MKPTKFPQSIVTLKGPAGSEIGDLPTWTDGKSCLSCWKSTWRERLSFLLTGKMWLWVVSGYTQPPVCVSVDEPTWHKPLSEPDPEKRSMTVDDVRAIVRAVIKRQRKGQLL